MCVCVTFSLYALDIDLMILFPSLMQQILDDIWKIHRRSLNYSFNLKILQTFVPIFIENAKALVNDLAVNIVKKKEFDMLSYTTKAALNMICGN